jgi:Tol biopolymer transport system component
MEARATALALAALLLSPVATEPDALAQGRGTAEVRLQAAVHAELVEGDLERALRLYREIAADRSAGRGVAATALVNLGRTYEKLGNAQARSAYERVVRDYGDQVEQVRLARARLQTLMARTGTGDRAGEPTFRLVLGDLNLMPPRGAAPFDFPLQGNRVVFTLNHPRGLGTDTFPTRRIYVADQSGTLVRPALRDPGTWQWSSFPRWSPDGRYIAFVGARSAAYARLGSQSADSVVERALFIVDPDEGTARRIGTPHPLRGGAPIMAAPMWTPDGLNLTFRSEQNLVTVDLEGRTVRSVPVERSRRLFGGYSPDGRWVVFHEVNAGSEQDNETDVWILPATGGRALQVTHAPGFDGFPSWSRDGRAVYFVSDRAGSPNVWRQPLDRETGLAQGNAEQVTFYTDANVTHPRVLADGRLAFGLVRTNTAIHVAPTGRPEERRTLERGRDPLLSPDGRTVFYVGEGAENEGIWAVPAEGGAARRLTPMMPAASYLRRFHVSPDGRTVTFFSRVGDGVALFTVPAAGGEPRQLLRLGTREFLAPAFSPDGSLIAYSTGNGLYVMPATGGEPRRLAQLYGWEGWTVRWSPDGRLISALGYVAPGEENAAFVVPAAGGELRRLTPPEENEYKEALEWHPSGERLSYMYYHDGGGDGTRQAFLDGRPTELLVNLPEPMWDYFGNWAPDGRHFYFIAAPRGSGNQWGLFAYDETTRTTSVISPAVSPEQGNAAVPSFSGDGRLMAWTTTRVVGQVWLMENLR